MNSDQTRSAGNLPRARTVRALLGFGTRAGAAALRPVADIAAGAGRTGLKLERRSRMALTDAARETVRVGIDGVLCSSHADAVLRGLLTAPITERAVGVALEGPLVDAVARDIARYGVLERVLVQMLEVRAAENILMGEGVARVLDGPELERLVDAVFASGFLDYAVNRLLDSDALWRLVTEVADSPAVTAAITQQGFGFADQVGDAVRDRSRRADSWLERSVRRVARRRPDSDPPGSQAVPEGDLW
jgi:hypothetical protein